jgi:hypothetical protein
MSIRSQAKQQVIVNGNMAGSLTSQVTLIPKLSMVTYAFSWSGSSPVGTVTCSVSNDYAVDAEGNVSNAGTWNILPFTDSTGTTVTSFALSGGSGVGFLEVVTGAYAIRTVYTRTSGTGTLQATLNSKVT